MRVLLTGATGLIGSAVLARLQAEGHEVWAVARTLGLATRGLEPEGWIVLDIARATRAADWQEPLSGVEAVVNCAGVLQDSGRDSTSGVHRDGPAALFAACETAGVRRVIQVSALGVERDDPTAFARSKAEGDAELMRRALDWVVLRPAVVVGRSAYGGSALLRGLAALPALPHVDKAGEIQFVQLDDVAATVAWFLRPDAPSRLVLELAAPGRFTFTAAVARYRRWLGFPVAHRIPGAPLLPLAFRLGDAASRFGWRPPIRTTAWRELVHGVTGDPSPWITRTGIQPRTLDASLAAEPASVQDRWFANLYFLKPAALIVFAVFWIATGLITLGPGFVEARSILEAIGAGALSGPATIAGGCADLAIGLALAWRRSARPALWAALALSFGYLGAATVLASWLWADPLGPLVKVLPIVVLNLMCLAVLDDR